MHSGDILLCRQSGPPRNQRGYSDSRYISQYNQGSVSQKEWLDVVVTIVCWLTMAPMVFLQEDEDVPSVYRNLNP